MSDSVNRDVIYFKVRFQQKSVDNLKFNKTVKDTYEFLPKKDSSIGLYSYNIPFKY